MDGWTDGQGDYYRTLAPLDQRQNGTKKFKVFLNSYICIIIFHSILNVHGKDQNAKMHLHLSDLMTQFCLIDLHVRMSFDSLDYRS